MSGEPRLLRFSNRKLFHGSGDWKSEIRGAAVSGSCGGLSVAYRKPIFSVYPAKVEKGRKCSGLSLRDTGPITRALSVL